MKLFILKLQCLLLDLQCFWLRCRMCNFNIINIYKYYFDKEIICSSKEIDYILNNSPFDNI